MDASFTAIDRLAGRKSRDRQAPRAAGQLPLGATRTGERCTSRRARASTACVSTSRATGP